MRIFEDVRRIENVNCVVNYKLNWEKEIRINLIIK